MTLRHGQIIRPSPDLPEGLEPAVSDQTLRVITLLLAQCQGRLPSDT
jgi:hypothetical protein